MEKLVRDNMPELCERGAEFNKEGGWTKMTYRVAPPFERLIFLLNKLVEESTEVKEAVVFSGTHREKIVEELADLKEVNLAVQTELGISDEEVENVRQNKRNHRGGFEKGIIWDGNK